MIARGIRLTRRARRRPKPDRRESPRPHRPGGRKGEETHYTGKVKDKDAGKPIAGATVASAFRLMDPEPANKNDHGGVAAHPDAGERIVHDPPRSGRPSESTSSSKSRIRLRPRRLLRATTCRGSAERDPGERSFFENVGSAARPIRGRVETPDGPAEPAGRVPRLLQHRQVQAGRRGRSSYG